MSQTEAVLLLAFVTLVCGTVSLFRYPPGRKDLTQAALPKPPALLTLLFSGIAFLGVFAWWGYPPDLGKIHSWEHFHYYLGTKYFDELGYSGLYNCALRADLESDAPTKFPGGQMRDLGSNTFISYPTALGYSQRCRDKFSDERWKDFGIDVGWFKVRMKERWLSAFHDHGYNPSPWWIWVAKWILPSGSASDDALKQIARWDLMLMVALWSCLFLSFDLRAVCFAAVFWGVNPLANGSWTAGAYLRHDWLFALVVSVLALSRRRYYIGGAALAYAVCSRIFPVLLLFGLLCSRSKSGSQDKKWGYCGGFLSPEVIRTSVGFGLTVGFLGAVSVSSFGPQSWLEFFANTEKHVNTRGGNLVGVGHVVDHLVQCSSPQYQKGALCEPPERLDETPNGWVRRTVSLGLGVLFFAWLAWRSAQLSLVETVCLSALALPLMLSPGSYYYELLLLPALASARFPKVGLLLIALVSILIMVAATVSPPNKVYLAASVIITQAVALVPLLLLRIQSRET